MASKAKPTGTTRNTTSSKKPATIDLDAKEIKAEAQTKTANTKTAASTTAQKNEAFGRPKNMKPDENKTSAKTASAKSPAKSDETSKKEDNKKPAAETKSKATETTETAAKASATKTPEPKPAKSSGSFFGKLSSAFMGGIAALVGFGAIGLWEGARELPIIGNFYGGSQSASDTGEIDALKAEIAALKKASSSQSTDLGPINEKLSALETKIAQISDASGDSKALVEQITKVEQDLSAVNTSIAEITAAAADGSNYSPAALSTAISSLDKRLETLEADIGNVADSVTKNPKLDSVTTSIGSLETQIQGIATSVATLKKSTNDNAQSLAGLTEQSETLETTVASVKASEKVAKSVAVNALATALENNDALSLPIASVKALLGATPETARLEEINNQGIPTRKDLETALDDFTASIRNPNAPPEDGSIADRFWANAQNMVSFRASGPREGDDALSILSRVKANVEKDDLLGAKGEWEKLPAEVAEQGASWLSKLNTRIEAFGLKDALHQKLTAEAG